MHVQNNRFLLYFQETIEILENLKVFSLYQILMSFQRFHREWLYRLSFILKDNAYFLHTEAPFPSVFIVLPNKKQQLKPLIRQLNRKENFSLEEELKKFKLNKIDLQSQNIHSNDITSTGIYGIKFNDQTQFLVSNHQQQLSLTKETNDKEQIYGVILFKRVTGVKINYMYNNYWQLNSILLKFFVVYTAWVLIKYIKEITRYENQTDLITKT